MKFNKSLQTSELRGVVQVAARKRGFEEVEEEEQERGEVKSDESDNDDDNDDEVFET